MEQHAHFFYALELPAEVKEKLEKAKSELQEALPFKTWVHPQDLHITLAFLGNAGAPQMDAANNLIDSALSRQFKFELAIDHLGTFGRKDSPRIFWAGLEESKSLSVVREDVFSACLSAGFKLETRPFSPHITLARKWTGESSFTYKLIEEKNPFKDEKINFYAERVVLYRTHLGKSPKYEPLTIFPLASRS
ncbi:RNA 2',3'-cyclic phosphodiesterase [Heyndrickxia sp. MSNUG]|uniref:RNA 2',3'-cyclic phosphodiesterase n=1 Tax=Heyndrickxia sp. MSNUG TaxID=3136677 RepID=UPI003C2CC75A